jgi:hypothetical protein
VKEIQDPIVDALKAGAKFVDPVSEIIRLGPAKFMSDLSKALNSHAAFVLSFDRETIQPV